MPRLKSDLLELLHATATGRLAGKTVEWRDETALTVVMATRGYPGSYGKGSAIGPLPADDDRRIIFHAGTRRDGNRLVANGGRVLNVTALGADVAEAQRKAYAAVAQIDWPDGFCRTDIGWREVARERNGASSR
jgi:phosphoribosylamine--glycine ligase